jgi:hypothetical protein
MAGIVIEVKEDDALSHRADVLALKHAQALYGVDALVVGRLSQGGRLNSLPKSGKFSISEGVGAVGATSVLFLGVPNLYDFGYAEIRKFGRRVLSVLSKELPSTKSLALTIHGPGYGLDEIEAFESEIAGLLDAIRDQEFPESLRRITIVENDRGRVQRLKPILSTMMHRAEAGPAKNIPEELGHKLSTVGFDSNDKPHVFVAMPFRDDLDDHWELGIRPAVRAAGFVCERADMASFSGDVIEWVRNRIKTSSYVVAVLTDANPNVYLEVGYAWGVGVPTVLLVNDPAHLKFDVRGQRCLIYKKITELKTGLKKELGRFGKKGIA